MMNVDEEALICDLAETYNIYNMESMPANLVGILANGLRDDSRIKMKISGEKISLDTLLRAAMLDNLAFLSWTKTKDAQDGRNKPESIVNALQGKDKDENNDYMTFDTGEDFFKMWNEITKG